MYIILAQDHKSSFSQSIATCVLPVIVLLPCQDFPMMSNPICVSQPCSLTEKKKSRVGSVVMPYILSSTLHRMSTISTLSTASSGLSSGSTSSDGHSCMSSQESVPASSPCFLYLPFPLSDFVFVFLCCHHCVFQTLFVFGQMKSTVCLSDCASVSLPLIIYKQLLAVPSQRPQGLGFVPLRGGQQDC